MVSDQLSLTPRTLRVVRAIFPVELWERVQRTLLTECGPIQIHSQQFGIEAMERIWLATLKVSGDNLDRFENAVLLARIDWRDLLVSAGFASDGSAHLRWADELTV